MRELVRARPGYGFLMEERGEIEGADRTHRFIVDPLDGTTNFLHGIPHFAISIALEREGELVAGLIFNPADARDLHRREGQGRLSQRPPPQGRGTDRARRLRHRHRHPASRQARPDLFLDELRAVMAASRRRAPHRRRRARPRLDRGRGFDGYWERNLAALGPRRRHRHPARGRRLRHRRRRQGRACWSNGSVVAGNEAIHRKLLKLLKSRQSA